MRRAHKAIGRDGLGPRNCKLAGVKPGYQGLDFFRDLIFVERILIHIRPLQVNHLSSLDRNVPSLPQAMVQKGFLTYYFLLLFKKKTHSEKLLCEQVRAQPGELRTAGWGVERGADRS